VSGAQYAARAAYVGAKIMLDDRWLGRVMQWLQKSLTRTLGYKAAT